MRFPSYVNHLNMVIKITFIFKTFFTLLADRISFFSMDHFVLVEDVYVITRIIAQVTWKPLHFTVVFFSQIEIFFDIKNINTNCACKMIS